MTTVGAAVEISYPHNNIKKPTIGNSVAFFPSFLSVLSVITFPLDEERIFNFLESRAGFQSSLINVPINYKHALNTANSDFGCIVPKVL